MCSGRLYLYGCIAVDDHRIRVHADRERCIYTQSGIGVHRQACLSLRSKSWRGDGEIVVAHGQVGERIQALSVRLDSIGRMLRRIDQFERRIRYHGAALICDRAGDAAAGRRPQRGASE